MIVKCKVKTLGKMLPDELKKLSSFGRSRLDKDYQERIEYGKKYVVHAFGFFEKNPVVFLDYHEGQSATFPTWFPLEFFEIYDSRISKYWIINPDFNSLFLTSSQYEVFSFPEWINNPDFYENILEENEKELTQYSYYKQLMNQEYQDGCDKDGSI